MYANCNCIGSARKLFDISSNRDVISWTAMVSGYVKARQLEIARKLFDEMPVRNVVSWSAMITGYSQVGMFKEALELFNEMQIAGVQPNHAGIVGALTACGFLGVLDHGRWIHAYVDRNGFRLDRILGTALIDMYSKCGLIETALRVFSGMPERDVFAFTSMISGLTNHGLSPKAVELFLNMREEGVKSNEVTFICVLSACNRMGMVEEGLEFFRSMKEVYGIEPGIEHCGCLVDLLGRAGRLEEAKKLVIEMPMNPDSYVLGALLNACRIHNNVELGKETVESLVERSLDHGGVHVLSNMYASAHRWEDVAKVRKKMEHKNLKKVPGCSLIEVDGVVCEFVAGDRSHFFMEDIILILLLINKQLKSYGFDKFCISSLIQLLQVHLSNFPIASCSANNRCFYLLDLQENKDALNTAMEELKDARDDVKRRVDEAEDNPNEAMKCNHEVKGWLQRVQVIEGEVVKIIQKADQDIKGRCFGGYCPKNCWSARKIGKLVIRTKDAVNDLRSKGNFVDVAYRLPPPLVQREPVDLTVGMESMFDKVLRLLAEDEVRIMGLYGYGGVGKTTLLKQINNAFLKSTTTTSSSSSSSSSTHGFDVVILVVVSKVINIKDIHKEIGDRLGLSSPNERNICNALSKKNFLLLLDDIWERLDLQSIGVPRPENNKSKILFTTRSETVCGLMDANEMLKVQCLPWNEAWSLFQEKVGEVALNSFPRARELAKDVARECGGLPLALVTIGRAMSTKKTLQEWNHAITTLRRAASEFPGMGDEVLPLLRLSYDSLRNDGIKSCFLHCALFPEDHAIKKAKLVDYWIGEGLILLNEFDHIDEARNHGYDVIGNLKGACLLESCTDEDTYVKMHDTIRDLALWIAHECGSKRDKFLIMDTSDITSVRLWYNAERIYLLSLHSSETEVPPLNSPNLLTLINDFKSLRDLSIPQNFFGITPLLRVLDLSYSNMETFPTSITELLELRYLSLHGTHIQVLPEELRKLVKLKYLDLSGMTDLEKIPSGVIGSLLELRVLNIYKCFRVVDWDIEGVCKLKHLNDLRVTVNSQPTLTVLLSPSNQNLQMCTRYLQLTTIIGVDSMRSLEKLELLSNLETLSFDSLQESMNMGVWENHYYYMAQEHQHLRSCSFQNLSKIDISNCNALKDLTWVSYVGNLKRLCVYFCEELEEIVTVVDNFGGREGDEICTMMSNVEDVFKRLETLKIMYVPKLKSICRNALAFPCLKSMCVSNCPQLKKLPLDSRSNVNNTLQKIQGESKWWGELQWEEDHDNNKLVRSKFLPYFVEFG